MYGFKNPILLEIKQWELEKNWWILSILALQSNKIEKYHLIPDI